MRIVRPKEDKELVNLTPLIDVVFNLLIFFMLTGSISTAEAFSINPATSTSTMRGNAEETIILVGKDGRLALGTQEITREQLPDIIRETLTANPGALIQLKPDSQADAAGVIDVMEGIRAGGAEYIVLMTVKRTGAPS